MTVETPWLKTTEGRVRFPVLKRFTFLAPIVHARGDGVHMITPRERHFDKGEHLLDPASEADAQVLAHPWIWRDFADGAVESPDRTCVRVEREAAEAKVQHERRQALLAEAAIALDRSIVQAKGTADAGADVEDELNTPLNQMRVGASGKKAKGGTRKDADIEIDSAALHAQLDTPLNQLPKAGAASSPQATA